VPRETIKWIGECGFSQGDEEIIKKFKDMTAMSTSIDLAIMISIDEKPWCSPTRDSTIDVTIRALPEMSIDDFVHDTLDSPDITDGPVAVAGYSWLKIDHVRFTLFMRDPNTQNFDFDSRDPAHFIEGVRTRSSLSAAKYLTIASTDTVPEHRDGCC
jgi:hypothetical protein